MEVQKCQKYVLNTSPESSLYSLFLIIKTSFPVNVLVAVVKNGKEDNLMKDIYVMEN